MQHNLEIHHKYKNVIMAVLEKGLDDICPKFLSEPSHIRSELIKERKILFAQQEKQIDAEWKQLVREAKEAISTLKKQRTEVLAKIEKTRRTKRIKKRLKQLQYNKKIKAGSYKRKYEFQFKLLQQEQKQYSNKDSKKYNSFSKKLETLTKRYHKNIENLEQKYEKVIANVNKTNNDDKVDKRLAQAHKIWAREKTKLEKLFQLKEDNFIDKRMEFDCIRLATEDFINNVPLISHYCLMLGIPTKTCYLEVKERLKLIGRKSLEIEEIINSLA